MDVNTVLHNCLTVTLIIIATLPIASAGIENSPAAMKSEADEYERDREAILAMAGNYDVTFDFIETVPFAEGYELRERSVSKGHEIVRVIEDRGDFISLQHILVTAGADPRPVKHWRQDWQYEPESVLVYTGGNTWRNRPVSAAEAKGKWSQVVYQVDDAPRYGAMGAWAHDYGVSQWQPPSEWRPLPRRDATKRSDYHVIDGMNRHTITPFGWVHEQDNAKVRLTGEPQIIAREIGVNTYQRSDDFSIGVAEQYWHKTAGYWSAVRSIWSGIEAEHEEFGLTIQGEPVELYSAILRLANEVESDDISVPAAAEKAKQIISSFVDTDPDPLAERLVQNGSRESTGHSN